MSIATRLGAGLVAAALLVGCGSGQDTAGPGEETSSDTSEPTPSPSETLPPGPIDFTQIAMVSESNVDGTVEAEATVLGSEQAVDQFAGQFSGAQMGQSLAREYDEADVPDGEVLVGAVVDISCQAPSKVQVEKTNQGVEVTAVAQKSKVEVQCLVPVTTVALVSVPEAAV